MKDQEYKKVMNEMCHALKTILTACDIDRITERSPYHEEYLYTVGVPCAKAAIELYESMINESPPRKIIHFENRNTKPVSFVALADDGTLWDVYFDSEKPNGKRFGEYVWRKIPSVPQKKIKAYEESAIKKAYWKCFHKAGEIYFNHIGTKEENENSTEAGWLEFIEILRAEK